METRTRVILIALAVNIFSVVVVNVVVVTNMMNRFDKSWDRIDNAMNAVQEDYQELKDDYATLKEFVKNKYPEDFVERAQTQSTGWLDAVRDRLRPDESDE